MIRILPALLACAALLVATPGARAEQFLRIGAGLAGTYPVFAAKFAELINDNIPGVRASTLAGPTEQNLIRVQKGDAEFCLTYTFQSIQVRDGSGALKVPAPDLRHVMSLYGAYYMAVAQKDSEITSLRDLAKKPTRVWLGPKASIFYSLNLAALAAHDVTPDDIVKAGGVISTAGYQNVSQAFQDGQVDVAFFSGPAPYSLLMELDRTSGFKFLSFDAAAAKKYATLLPGAGTRTLKGGLYKSAPDEVVTPYVFNEVVTSAKLPDDLIYQITKLMNEKHETFHGLFAGSEEIRPQTALEYNGIPVHPGAEKYYREVGLIK
jgi:TRAP transporter TAXI family solute receptor